MKLVKDINNNQNPKKVSDKEAEDALELSFLGWGKILIEKVY